MIVNGKNRWTKYIEFLDIIALITYGFMIFTSMSRNARFSTVWPEVWYTLQQFCLKVCLVIAVVKIILFYETSKRETIAAMVLLLLTAAGKFIGFNDYLYVVAPIVMFFHTPFQKIARCYLIILGTNLIFTVLYALMGVIPDYYIPIAGRGDRLIHHLGFSNHNAIMAYWLFIFLTAICLLSLEKKRHIRIVFLTVLLSISGLLYYFTDSKTSFLLILVMGFIALVEWIIPNKARQPYCKKAQDIIFRGMFLVPLFALIITAVGTLIYNMTGYRGTGAIATVFSRFYLLNNALESVGVRLPNQTIAPELINPEISFHWILGTGADNLGGGDILYGNLLMRDGLIALVLYLSIQLYMMYRAYRHKNYIFFLVLVLLALFGCSESCVLDIAFTVFSCLLFADWTKWDKSKQMVSSDTYNIQEPVDVEYMIQHPYRKKLYFTMGCCIYVFLTVGLFFHFKEKMYNTFSYLPTQGLIKQTINEEGVQQFFETDDLRGLRLYLYNPENISEGRVVVRICEEETHRSLFQDEISIRQLSKENYFNYKEYVDVLSDTVLPASASGYSLDISVNKSLPERLVYYATSEGLVFKTLNKSIPFQLILWNLLTCYGVYAVVFFIIWGKSSFIQKKDFAIYTFKNKERWLLVLILFPVLLIGFGWLTKGTFHYERQLLQIRDGDFSSKITLEPNRSYSGRFRVRDKNIAEIQLDILNSWEENENYTIAIKTKEGDVLATKEGNQLERNNYKFIWDISEIAFEKNESYDLCIFTGEFGSLSVPTVKSVSCVYGRNSHSKVRYLLFGLTVIISFLILYFGNTLIRIGNKKNKGILLWVLFQAIISFLCSNGLFIANAGTTKQRVVLFGIGIGTVICAICCGDIIIKKEKAHNRLIKIRIVGVLLPFVSFGLSVCFNIASSYVWMPYWIILSIFIEIILAYCLSEVYI